MIKVIKFWWPLYNNNISFLTDSTSGSEDKLAQTATSIRNQRTIESLNSQNVTPVSNQGTINNDDENDNEDNPLLSGEHSGWKSKWIIEPINKSIPVCLFTTFYRQRSS